MSPTTNQRSGQGGHSVPELITLAPSHYCEKARWALDYCNVAYKEKVYPPMFHMAKTMRSRVGRTTPQLWLDGRVLGESTGIVEYADQCAGGGALIPTDENQRKEAYDWDTLVNRKLGPATRAWAYYHVLDKPYVMDLLVSGTDPLLGNVARKTGPALVWLMRRGLNISYERAQRSLEKITQVFDEIDKTLSDGRTFLVGNRFSLADLSVASLAAPAVFPANYGGSALDIAKVPGEMRETVRRFSDRPAGKFVHTMFNEHRKANVQQTQ